MKVWGGGLVEGGGVKGGKGEKVTHAGEWHMSLIIHKSFLCEQQEAGGKSSEQKGTAVLIRNVCPVDRSILK